jgi:hypothetical protein
MRSAKNRKPRRSSKKQTSENSAVQSAWKPSFDNLGCKRQVFASLDAAGSTVRTLRLLDIEATIERCPNCNLIHLTEKRVAK